MLNPGKKLGMAYCVNMIEALHLLGKYQLELAEADRCGKLYPGPMTFLFLLARAQIALGRLDEAEKAVQEPSGGFMSWCAQELRAHGHSGASIKMAGGAYEWFRERRSKNRGAAAVCLYQAERWEEARAIVEALANEEPDNIDFQGLLGSLSARRGDRTEAMRISEQLRRMDRPYLFGENTYARACISAQLGQKEQAVDLLKEAISQGFYDVVPGLVQQCWTMAFHTDMDLEPLHGYPPYEELIKPKD